MKVMEYSSNHKILYSNSAILYDRNSDFVLDITMDEDFSFKVVIKFEEKAKGGITRSIEDTTNTVTLTMHDKLDATMGPSQPIRVASYEQDGKEIEIYLQYVIRKLYNGEYKMITYTLFEG